MIAFEEESSKDVEEEMVEERMEELAPTEEVSREETKDSCLIALSTTYGAGTCIMHIRSSLHIINILQYVLFNTTNKLKFNCAQLRPDC